MSNSISPATTVQAALHLHQRGDVDAAESVYRRVLDAEPNNVDALHLLGMLLLEQGNPKKSETLLRSASTHAPSSGILANSLGVCLMRQARYNEALAQFQLAFKFEGCGVDVLQNMGEVCEKLQRFEEAIKYWERLLGIAPEHDEVRRLLASVLEGSGEIQQAAAHLFYVVCRDTAKERDVLALANLLQRNLQAEAVLSECRQRLSRNLDHVGLNQLVGCVLASRLSPTHAAQLSLPEQRELRLSAIAHLERAAEVRPSHLSYDLVGRNLMEIHCPEKAIVWLEKAVASNPTFAPAYECLGAALLSLGEIDAATVAFERALKFYPRSPLANFELARLRQSPSEPTISQIKHELSSAKILRDDRILLHAALGHRYLSEEQPEAAWKHFCESGELKTDQEPRVCAEVYRADTIIESLRKARPLIRDNSSRSLSYKMVFVIGMPRSGTTLLEQILASHDDVVGCGELTFISSLAGGLSKRFGLEGEFPEACLQLDEKQTQALRHEYLNEVDRLLADDPLPAKKQYAIDKMPTNFRFLGLIRQLFPDSKILHVSRDPRDVAVSCLEQNLAWPFCVPSDLSTYIQHYQQIMRHAEELIGPDLLTVRYERLVQTPRDEIASILTFLGLPWRAECLRFNETKRAVNTPSKQQVRQPIYTGSVGKWKQYADCDTEFFQSIEPAIMQVD